MLYVLDEYARNWRFQPSYKKTAVLRFGTRRSERAYCGTHGTYHTNGRKSKPPLCFLLLFYAFRRSCFFIAFFLLVKFSDWTAHAAIHFVGEPKPWREFAGDDGDDKRFQSKKLVATEAGKLWQSYCHRDASLHRAAARLNTEESAE